ncbi:MAG: PIG-L family deacetylase [Minisyncoccia bacterium]|jgi:LmbE family N-acetylglucosaminyl deacetylase
MRKELIISIFAVLFLIGLVCFAFPKPQNTQSFSIILSPHFDDAVLSLGGLMAKRENQTLVATFFGGKPAVVMHTDWDIRSGFSDSDDAILMRESENRSALAPFSATIKNYGYLDFQYGESRNDEQNRELRENITRDIESIISENHGRQIFVYGPAVFGSETVHPDHQALYDAFVTAIKRNAQPNVRFFIYEDFTSIYKFVKTGMGKASDYPGNPDSASERTIIGLTESELGEKIKAVEAYKSQVASFKSTGDDIGSLIEEFYRERCGDIAPPTYACEIVYNEN